MNDQLKGVSHEYIRYANCWEDADILLKGLDIQPNDRVLSIGSAGDNSFSLLVNNPKIVVAVDVNIVQLNLIELKKAAIKELNYEQFLQFLGFSACDKRGELFDKLKKSLSKELNEFWSMRRDEIESGIIYQGKFEKYFQLFRIKILPFIHSKKRIHRLFENKSESEQIEFFEKKWNNLRWKMLFKIFFSRYVMGKFGRDPAFLKEVEVPVSTFILEKSKTHLSSKNCIHNYFLQFILTGKFQENLPHYARKDNFEKIKSNIDRLVVFSGLIEDAFNEYEGFNKFNLSNIFEYMEPELFKNVSEDIINNAAKNSKFAYWNLMVTRKISEIHPDTIQNTPSSSELSKIDMGFFYGNFFIETKI